MEVRGNWWLVPGGGVEPPRAEARRILSPLRLPVPPSRLGWDVIDRVAQVPIMIDVAAFFHSMSSFLTVPVCAHRYCTLLHTTAHNCTRKTPTPEFQDSALPSGRISGGTVAQPINKIEIYRLLYQLNRGFGFVVEQLRQMETTRFFPSKSLRNFRGFTQELQAEFNQEFLENLHRLELDDWSRYGKVRQAREKELSDPDDVFIKAEERRRELRKQALEKKKRKQNKKQP
jgi:hypothetical protein